jgi:putative endonuclease
LYVGVTDDLRRRIQEHKNGQTIFTNKYHIHKLVYYEETNSIEAALAREKRLKRWNRDWKLTIIERDNPNWQDLSEDIE